MKIFRKTAELSAACDKAKGEGKKIAFVPTMGALHAGHLSLVDEAFKRGDFVVVSIFVNRAQFNDAKDYEKYPRDVDADLALLGNVDAVFLPTHEEIYPSGIIGNYDAGVLGEILCGAHRKGHFNGVALVVSRFFEIIRPDFAIFGKKDFQQYLIVKKLAVKFKVKVIGIDTMRENSGLAMSSRNQRLSESARKKAAQIYRILSDIKKEIKLIENPEKFLQNKEQEFLDLGFQKIDYLEIRDEENLEKLSQKFDSKKKYRIFLAIFLDGVRLIDNVEI